MRKGGGEITPLPVEEIVKNAKLAHGWVKTDLELAQDFAKTVCSEGLDRLVAAAEWYYRAEGDLISLTREEHERLDVKEVMSEHRKLAGELEKAKKTIIRECARRT